MYGIMVSIIIPIYNAEATIGRCLQSLLTQTFADFELLLINDGSTDGSESVCLDHAKRDKRIVYVKKENGGVSSARNEGLGLAKGEKIAFVDIDDYVAPDYLERLAASDTSDLVLSGFHGSSGIDFVPDEMEAGQHRLQGLVPQLVGNQYLLYTPWAKLFDKHILDNNHILFDTSLRLYEDTIFVLTYLAYCRSVSILSYAGYYYIGEWGGTSKYRLTKEEVEHRCLKEYEALALLEKVFECNIDKRYRCVAIAYLDGLYARYTDKECLSLYGKYHSARETDDYLSDIYMFPSYAAVSQLKQYARDRKIAEMHGLLESLHGFFTIPTGKMNFRCRDEKLMYLLIKKGYLRFCFLLLKTYSVFKRNRFLRYGLK